MVRVALVWIALFGCSGKDPIRHDASAGDAVDPDAAPDADTSLHGVQLGIPLSFEEVVPGPRPGAQWFQDIAPRGTGFALLYQNDSPEQLELLLLDANGAATAAPIVVTTSGKSGKVACAADATCAVTFVDANQAISSLVRFDPAATLIDTAPLTVSNMIATKLGAYATGFILAGWAADFQSSAAVRLGTSGGLIGSQIDLGGASPIDPGCVASGCWIAAVDGGNIYYVDGNGSTLTMTAPTGFDATNAMTCNATACIAIGAKFAGSELLIARRTTGAFESTVSLGMQTSWIASASSSTSSFIAILGQSGVRGIQVPSSGAIGTPTPFGLGFGTPLGITNAACLTSRCVVGRGDGDAMISRVDGTTLLDSTPLVKTTAGNTQRGAIATTNGTNTLVVWTDDRLPSTRVSAARLTGSTWIDTTSIGVPLVAAFDVSVVGGNYVVAGMTASGTYGGVRVSGGGLVLEPNAVEWFMPQSADDQSIAFACGPSSCAAVVYNAGQLNAYLIDDQLQPSAPIPLVAAGSLAKQRFQIAWVQDRFVVVWNESSGVVNVGTVARTLTTSGTLGSPTTLVPTPGIIISANATAVGDHLVVTDLMLDGDGELSVGALVVDADLTVSVPFATVWKPPGQLFPSDLTTFEGAAMFTNQNTLVRIALDGTHVETSAPKVEHVAPGLVLYSELDSAPALQCDRLRVAPISLAP